jgi:hypothetical protein
MAIGFPESVLTDQGSALHYKLWKGACAAYQIQLRSAGIESHSSLNKGETIHHQIRHVYSKLSHEHPDLTQRESLALATQAFNETANKNDLCPSLLVFGNMPRIPNESNILPSQRDRFRAMEMARTEHSRLVAQSKVQRGLNKAAEVAGS